MGNAAIGFRFAMIITCFDLLCIILAFFFLIVFEDVNSFRQYFGILPLIESRTSVFTSRLWLIFAFCHVFNCFPADYN
jgi:hypothetical protein